MKILLGVTGSVATVLTPKLVTALEDAGHDVQVVATKSSLYFFDPGILPVKVWCDEDEWMGACYTKDQEIPHIALRHWADLLLIAPLSANTLAKMAHGLCDNLLTCVVRAWDFSKPLVLVPAMNTLMWQSPFTGEHLEKLRSLGMNQNSVQVIEPIAKRLACHDVGVGAMAKIETIVETITTPS